MFLQDIAHVANIAYILTCCYRIKLLLLQLLLPSQLRLLKLLKRMVQGMFLIQLKVLNLLKGMVKGLLVSQFKVFKQIKGIVQGVLLSQFKELNQKREQVEGDYENIEIYIHNLIFSISFCFSIVT